MKQSIFSLVLFILSSSQLLAQTKVVLRLDDLVTQEAQFCLDLRADSFPDIVTAQFSLLWDPAIMRFNRFELGDNPLSLQASNIFSPSDSTLGMSWIASDLQGISLAPETPLLSVCFDAQVSQGSTPLSFKSYLPGEFVQTNSTMVFPSQLIDGSVTIEDPTSTREISWAKEIQIYPNPNSGDHLQINGYINEIDEIKLLDSKGRQLRQTDKAASRFFIGHLPNGTYWLVLRKGAQVSRKTLIIQR